MRVLYDPTFSERGVLMCAGRKLRAKDPFDFQVRPCRLRCHPLILGVPLATSTTPPMQAGCTKGLQCMSGRTPSAAATNPAVCIGTEMRMNVDTLNPKSSQAPLVIHAPHALPLFREPRPGGKRKREKERQDPVKSQMPDRGGAAPLKPGTGGQIGATGGTLLTQYVLKNQARAGLGSEAHACCKCHHFQMRVLYTPATPASCRQCLHLRCASLGRQACSL